MNKPLARLVALALLLLPALAGAQKDETSRSWNQPVEPFRIVGNVYYVGASDITSFLITTPEGHVLLDGGFEETAPLIRAGIEKLGFKLADVRVLINSHAHFDHAGGLAALKAATGAKLAASAPDAPMLRAGGRGDVRFGDTMTFPPVQPDRLLADGDTVTLGGVTLTALLTPGHTPGCTTWTMRAEEEGKAHDVVFVCSTTVLPGDRLTGDRPTYPGIADDYAKTFRTLRELPCDVFLAAHGSFFGITDKARRRREGDGPNPFVDPAGYRAFLDRTEAAYRKRLDGERTPAVEPTRR